MPIESRIRLNYDAICANRSDIKDKMQETTFRFAAVLAIVTSLVAACTPLKSIEQSAKPEAPADRAPAAEPDHAAEAGPQTVPIIAPAADVLRAKPLPPAQKGALERIDCLTGTPDWHARIAFEAQDGQVLGFAYYSKWRPRTCSIDLMRNTAGSKWGTAADGAVRVDTPHGRFLIRTRAEAYEFAFEHVKRGKFCGMPGEINGTLTVKRGPGKPQCSAAGIMDTNDSYLDRLYKSGR
jgi:hypothetical protein